MRPADPGPPDSFPGKTEARAWARGFLRTVSPGERAARSAAASDRVAGLEAFRRCGLLLAFLSMPAEIDTSGLIRAAFLSGKRVAAPRMEGGEIVFAYLDESWESLPRDALGIPTPPAGVPIPAAGLRRLDVFALIPGLLFDRAGGRLGRGKGYYDRFLSSVLRNLGADDPVGTEPVHEGLEKFFVPCGFCYQAQVVGRVPLTGRDVRVPLIATEAGIIRA